MANILENFTRLVPHAADKARPVTPATAPWSAHNLPKPKPPRALRLAVVAVTAGLVTVLFAAALGNPIRTAGSRMEPARFQTFAQQGKHAVPADSAARPFNVASVPAHR